MHRDRIHTGTIIEKKNPRISILPSIATILVIVLTGACADESSGEAIVLPSTPILSLEANWVVITSTHLRLREQSSIESPVVTTLWRGNVLEVLSKQNRREEIEGETDYWYQVRYGGLQGWVFGSYLGFHSSYEAAVSAGEKLRQ